MDKNHAPTPEDETPSAPPPEAHPEHPDWLNRRIGAELKRLRTELGLSAYELGRPDSISDQSILNNESGLKNPGIKTLARHCQLLGTSLPKVIDRVTGQNSPP